MKHNFFSYIFMLRSLTIKTFLLNLRIHKFILEHKSTFYIDILNVYSKCWFYTYGSDFCVQWRFCFFLRQYLHHRLHVKLCLLLFGIFIWYSGTHFSVFLLNTRSILNFRSLAQIRLRKYLDSVLINFHYRLKNV